MVHHAYLLTGSNLGHPKDQLTQALRLIQDRAGKLIAQSRVYRTSPWGKTDQPDFYNQALHIETSYSPFELLPILLHIEQDMGRNREEKWGARFIDIDILLVDNLTINGNLQIPHPLVHERKFALLPLSTIAPNLMHPGLQKTILQLLHECRDSGIVEPAN